MTYKNGSRIAQARLRRPTGKQLPSYEEAMTTEQRRDCIKAAIQSIEDELKTERCGYRRKQLGKRKHDLQIQISALRPKKKAVGVQTFFIDAAKEFLTPAHYNILMKRAVEMLREHEAKMGKEMSDVRKEYLNSDLEITGQDADK